MTNEDEELLKSLGEGSDDIPKKKKGDSKNEPKTTAKSIQDEGVLNPRDEFLDILKDIGLKRGIEVMADVFYTGDINSPEWLDQTLSLGSVSVPHRRLIITRYYGESPESLGLDMIPSSKLNKGVKKEDEDTSHNSMMRLKQTQAQILKDRFEAANMKAMLRDLEGGNDEKDKPRRIVERPLIDQGEIVMKDGVPVMERIITHGNDYAPASNDMNTMLAFLKMMDNKDNKYDPNAKPTWAVELENQIKINKSDEEKRRLEDELRREKEKRDETEKEYKKELDKAKEMHQKDIEKFSKDTDDKFNSIKESFNAELRHRDEMEQMKQQFGQQFGELKDELDITKKDIKSAVVGEVTKTGSKVIENFTTTVSGVVTPMADVMKDMYKTQIEMMRKNSGINIDQVIPETTNEELKELME